MCAFQLSRNVSSISTCIYFFYSSNLKGQGSTLLLYQTEGGEMSHPGLANLWHPDTHVLNAKSSHRPETVTKIKSSGTVETRYHCYSCLF